MKSLLIKTILVVSAVALTSILAWSQTMTRNASVNSDCKVTANWSDNTVCDPSDPTLFQGLNKSKSDSEGIATQEKFPGGCYQCWKNAKLQEMLGSHTKAPERSTGGEAPAAPADGQQ